LKVLALDLGDKHTGIAISDALKMFAQPYKTIDANNIYSELNKIFEEENIDTVIIGHPKTLRDTKSEQTIKVENIKKELENKFETVKWILWDERLTSKSAQNIRRPKNKNEKLKIHAIAAAIILSSYLDSQNV
jgi:putative holliday junction resolvase